MPACSDSVKRLLDHFDQQADQVRSADYNEAQLRIDFVNPMFAALGWDLDNAQGFAEQYREVVHEDRVKVAGQTKAPDYSFRIGGVRKFFLEAKKPHTDIKNSWEPAYQLRRYGWSAKLAVSLLTDFAEMAVYDCRIAPRQMEKAAVARREYIAYQQYPDRWDFIEGTFSKRAVMQGQFDRYCQAQRGRGAQEFDDAFLEEIEAWRKLLAGNLALRNAELSEASLNFAVQRIIDRIIFLRICEDRGIERAGRLQGLLGGDAVYPRLFKLFHEADARYNSGLFHFRPDRERGESPDELTEKLDVDDRSLKDIIRRLYYPESPYEFTVVSADILGSVYERFLGKVISLTDGHRARVEEKPEVRKAGGVFYTPEYIVQYIVKETVGKLLGEPGGTGLGLGGPHADEADGLPIHQRARSPQAPAPKPRCLTPKDAAKLKILDPSCGSGSFLLGAYQYLLDWHLAWYVADGPEKWSKGKNATLRPGPQGDWRLTIRERKRILLDNIHGVDIDFQAVEVTKLSLLLRVLEGETAESLGALWTLFHERALPDLGCNIQCGNSLIGADIMNTEAWAAMSEEERRKVNPFDFERAFPEVFKRGGFDAVIGNPPYVRMEEFKPIKAYLKGKYDSHGERSDLYAYFMERGHRVLNDRGRFGMIVSNKFVRADYGAPLRAALTALAQPVAIVDFAGLPVFEGATVRTLVYLSRRERADGAVRYSAPPPAEQFERIRSKLLVVADDVSKRGYEIPLTGFTGAAWQFAPAEVNALMERLKRDRRALVDEVDGQICMGVKSGLTEAFLVGRRVRDELIAENPEAAEILKPLLNGRDVRRYCLRPDEEQFLIYTYHGVDIRRYPAVQAHLRPFKARLEKRATRQEWYELQQPQLRFAPFMDAPKLIFPDIATEPRFALDDAGFYGTNTIYFIPRPDRRLLGVLNSRLAFFFFRETCAGLEGGGEVYLRFFGQYLEQFPVAVPDPKSRAAIGDAAEAMLSLHKRLCAETLPQRRDQLQREIDVTDRRIDQLVYELYGLSDAEIRIVEEATR